MALYLDFLSLYKLHRSWNFFFITLMPMVCHAKGLIGCMIDLL